MKDPFIILCSAVILLGGQALVSAVGSCCTKGVYDKRIAVLEAKVAVLLEERR